MRAIHIFVKGRRIDVFSIKSALLNSYVNITLIQFIGVYTHSLYIAAKAKGKQKYGAIQ